MSAIEDLGTVDSRASPMATDLARYLACLKNVPAVRIDRVRDVEANWDEQTTAHAAYLTACAILDE